MRAAVDILVVAALCVLSGLIIRAGFDGVVRGARGKILTSRIVLRIFVRVPGLRRTVREPFRSQYSPRRKRR